MTGLGWAAAVGAADFAPPVVAVGLAAAALFAVWVVVASAAFFFVGIVAFRSVGAAAFGAAVLVGFEIAAVFGAGLAALDGVVLVRAFAAGVSLADVGLPRAGLPRTGLDATPLRDAVALAAVALFAAVFDTVLFDFTLAAPVLAAARVFSTFGVVDRAFAAAGLWAALRPRAVVGFAAVALVARVALVRFTDAAGCAAVRAAALDGAAGLAVRGEVLRAVFAPPVLAEVADLLAAAFDGAGFAAAGLAEAALATADFLTTALAALRSRATGLVLGDMCATPGSDVRQKRDRCDASRHVVITPMRRRRLRKFDRRAGTAPSRLAAKPGG